MKARTFVFLVITFLTFSLSTGIFLTWWSSGHHLLKAAEIDPFIFIDTVAEQHQNVRLILSEEKDANSPCINTTE